MEFTVVLAAGFTNHMIVDMESERDLRDGIERGLIVEAHVDGVNYEARGTTSGWRVNLAQVVAYEIPEE